MSADCGDNLHAKRLEVELVTQASDARAQRASASQGAASNRFITIDLLGNCDSGLRWPMTS